MLLEFEWHHTSMSDTKSLSDKILSHALILVWYYGLCHGLHVVIITLDLKKPGLERYRWELASRLSYTGGAINLDSHSQSILRRCWCDLPMKRSLVSLLDLVMTFNSMHHTILLDRLETMSHFDDVILQCIRSYLHDRIQVSLYVWKVC